MTKRLMKKRYKEAYWRVAEKLPLMLPTKADKKHFVSFCANAAIKARLIPLTVQTDYVNRVMKDAQNRN